jgi:formamidopyrimidine-DNA glycosylase
MIFDDIRCFGTLEVYEKLADSKSLLKLGIEPLSAELNPNFFIKRMSSSTREIKTVLLDQKIVVGLGNIYASEILFRSRIHPQRAAGKLLKNEWTKIIKYTQSILEEAIKNNGTTISDFRRVDDKTGKFQQFLQVYGKNKQACPKCDVPIQRIVQQQRSTFFCPECQK